MKNRLRQCISYLLDQQLLNSAAVLRTGQKRMSSLQLLVLYVTFLRETFFISTNFSFAFDPSHTIDIHALVLFDSILASENLHKEARLISYGLCPTLSRQYLVSLDGVKQPCALQVNYFLSHQEMLAK